MICLCIFINYAYQNYLIGYFVVQSIKNIRIGFGGSPTVIRYVVGRKMNWCFVVSRTFVQEPIFSSFITRTFPLIDRNFENHRLH